MFDDTICRKQQHRRTETFTGLAGNDFIDGRGGFDIASYNNIYFHDRRRSPSTWRPAP